MGAGGYIISFLFISASVGSTPTCYSDKEIGSALSLRRGMQFVAQEMPRFFVPLLPCVCIVTQAGLSVE